MALGNRESVNYLMQYYIFLPSGTPCGFSASGNRVPWVISDLAAEYLSKTFAFYMHVQLWRYNYGQVVTKAKFQAHLQGLALMRLWRSFMGSQRGFSQVCERQVAHCRLPIQLWCVLLCHLTPWISSWCLNCSPWSTDCTQRQLSYLSVPES